MKNNKLIEKIKKEGIVKIENFLFDDEIIKFSSILRFYSAPKNSEKSYFPINYNQIAIKLMKLDIKGLIHGIDILNLEKRKKLTELANGFFEKKSKLSFIDGYYSKKSNKDVLPWHTDQAYSGEKNVKNFNNPDHFYLKIFIYLTDVWHDNGCMSYIPKSHKIGYAIRKGIFQKKISYQPYWHIKDFRKIILTNEKYFKEHFKGTEVIEDFFKETDNIENSSFSKKFSYHARAGTAIIFDEGGLHRGSKPQTTDRMVLRYLYSIH